MPTNAQILTIVGLTLEFIATSITIRKLFYGYYKRLQKGTFQEEIKKDRREGLFVLAFLVVGMTLQGIAVFM